MSIQLNPYIEQLSWAEARELILPVNPDFVRHADALDFPKECCIFKVRYRYGDYLLREGRPMFRNSLGDNVSIDNPSLPKIVREKLSYADTIPMGISLNKKLEIFFKTRTNRIIPIMLPEPGYIFALSGVLSRKNGVFISQGPFWNITAGVRQIYSVPKISISVKHKKLAKEFGISLDPPTKLENHWDTFKDLMHSETLENTWHSEVIFFSEEFPSLKSSPAWANFNNYLREYSWIRGDFLRTFYQVSYITSEISSYANIPTYPNLLNILKQIMSIAGQFMPGLSFNIGENAFPENALKKVYSEIYDLEHAPLFVGSKYFDPLKSDRVFYALSLPNMLEYQDGQSFAKSKFEELRIIAHSLEKIQKLTNENALNIQSLEQSFFRGLVQSKIQCYHSLALREKQITDSRLLLNENDGMESKVYCSSSLLRGLVSVESITLSRPTLDTQRVAIKSRK